MKWKCICLALIIIIVILSRMLFIEIGATLYQMQKLERLKLETSAEARELKNTIAEVKAIREQLKTQIPVTKTIPEVKKWRR